MTEVQEGGPRGLSGDAGLVVGTGVGHGATTSEFVDARFPHDFNSPHFCASVKVGDVVEFYDDDDPEDIIVRKRRVTTIRWSDYAPHCILIECDEKVP